MEGGAPRPGVFFGQRIAYHLIQSAFFIEPLLRRRDAVIQVDPENTLFRLPGADFLPADLAALAAAIQDVCRYQSVTASRQSLPPVI
jgi:hypothetical protein